MIITQRAKAIIRDQDALTWHEDGGVTYTGPCPAARGDNPHGVMFDHPAGICPVCGAQLESCTVRLPHGTPYLVITF